jgi:hypothetical protein
MTAGRRTHFRIFCVPQLQPFFLFESQASSYDCLAMTQRASARIACDVVIRVPVILQATVRELQNRNGDTLDSRKNTSFSTIGLR